MVPWRGTRSASFVQWQVWCIIITIIVNTIIITMIIITIITTMILILNMTTRKLRSMELGFGTAHPG